MNSSPGFSWRRGEVKLEPSRPVRSALWPFSQQAQRRHRIGPGPRKLKVKQVKVARAPQRMSREQRRHSEITECTRKADALSPPWACGATRTPEGWSWTSGMTTRTVQNIASAQHRACSTPRRSQSIPCRTRTSCKAVAQETLHSQLSCHRKRPRLWTSLTWPAAQPPPMTGCQRQWRRDNSRSA